jgi:hypothetical protein
MSNVNCSACGCELPGVDSGPCPKCGGMAKTVQLEARGQMMTSGSLKVSLRKIEMAVKKDWKLICILIVMQLIAVGLAYFLSGVASVIASVVVIIVTTIVGYFAITRVFTITHI